MQRINLVSSLLYEEMMSANEARADDPSDINNSKVKNESTLPKVNPRLIEIAKKVYDSNNLERAKHLVRIVANSYKYRSLELIEFASDNYKGAGDDSDIVRGLAKGAINHLANKSLYRINNVLVQNELVHKNDDLYGSSYFNEVKNDKVGGLTYLINNDAFNDESKDFSSNQLDIYKNSNKVNMIKKDLLINKNINSDYGFLLKPNREDFFSNSKQK